MLHGIHCIQSCCIKSTAFNRVPFLHAAWHTLHSNTLHGIHCIQSRSIGPPSMESTAFNWDPLCHDASIHCNQSESTAPHCIPIECSGFSAAWPKASRLNALDSI